MAAFLSRRLASNLLLQNPKNPSSVASLFHADAHFKIRSEHNPTNPLAITPNPTAPSLSPSSIPRPQSLFHESPTSPIPVFTRLYSSPESKLRNPNLNLLKFQHSAARIPLLERPNSLDSNPTARYFSSSPPENGGTSGPPQPPELQHQEIVGPTVERDTSALANETRQAMEGMRKSIYDLSSALALLGIAHLGLGAWIAYAVRPSDEVMVQGLMSFAFPFSIAFLMRRTLKPISFFWKMEEQGRLQILTLALQVSKSLNILFLRMRVVSFCCIVGLSAGSLVAIYKK